MGTRVAHSLVASSILDYIELSPDFSIVEIGAVQDWHDNTLGQLDIRAKYDLNVIAIKRKSAVMISPNANERLLKGDILVVVGQNKDIRKLEKIIE